MKPESLFAFLLFCGFAFTVNAQKIIYPKPADQIQYDKKIPPPVFNPGHESMANQPGQNHVKKDDHLRKKMDQFLSQPNIVTGSQNLSQRSQVAGNTAEAKKSSAGFHLTRDINKLAGSDPGSFAVLNNITYFFADDGPNGQELWRSDGTAAGTYMVMDINPGEAGCNGSGLTAANGLLYFSAFTPANGAEPWISDGTALGTHLLADCLPGAAGINPTQFVNVNGAVFFCGTAAFGTFNNQLWKTDGTAAGTAPVSNELFDGFGIHMLTAANGLAYFVAFVQTDGFQLFRSDGTAAGTYLVKPIGQNFEEQMAPMQLTAYNNRLYFSANDGTGRKLWTSDGTFNGTHLALGDNGILMQNEYEDFAINNPFRIINNILYMGAYTNADGGGLYRYDAAGTAGVELVKDFTSLPDAPDDEVIDYVATTFMATVNNQLYFKVINNTNGWQEELWKSDGSPAGTLLVNAIPANGDSYTYNYFNGNGTFYFVRNNLESGSELWKSDGSAAGTVMVRDINPGAFPSNPGDLTFCNGKLLFRALSYTEDIGSELWSSNGTAAGTSLVKDINSSYTANSYAGAIYKGITAFGKQVLFSAYTPQRDEQLYKSDGTGAGTVLLSDTTGNGITFTTPFNFIEKNKYSYFIALHNNEVGWYRTNGTTAGIKKMTPDINQFDYFVGSYDVAGNGLLFYILGNRATNDYELWRSDGTAAGNYRLQVGVSYYLYVVTIDNTAYFVATDAVHGTELWKSDGTLTGTKLVKDIYPGPNGATPYSLFAFQKEIYFGAYDGAGIYNSFWKSDGTEKGTVKLKNITPAFFNNFQDPAQRLFCISKNKLYFSATDFNTSGAELWVTNGTVKGTQLVKDINPFSSSNPDGLTDVDGTLYFTADDGTHGYELWKSDGSSKKTKMVRDISPGAANSFLDNLCSAGGRLYFLNKATYPYVIWASGGEESNTNVVLDPLSMGLQDIYPLVAAGNQLFFGASSKKDGIELYAGDAGKHVNPENAPNITTAIVENSTKFSAVIYPNPAKNIAWLQLTGNTNEAAVSITDISGKMIWQATASNTNRINLPVEKLPAGVYTVRVTCGTANKILKLVKE